MMYSLRNADWKQMRTLCSSGSSLLLIGRMLQLANALLLSILLVRLFGLETVGIFALGLIAVTFLAIVSPLGLPAYLPQVRESHPRLCFAGLVLQLALVPLIIAALALYSYFLAKTPAEIPIIFLVGSSGFLVGLGNTGLILAIMQQRYRVGLLMPVIETLALAGTWAISPTPLSFAVALFTARLVGAAIIWMGFRYESLSVSRLVMIIRRSVQYTVPDMLGVLSEQVAPLLLAQVATRADLGLYRLCQQLLTAADSPGWTFVQSKYPEMVSPTPGGLQQMVQQLSFLAKVSTALCAIGSIILAMWVYEVPVLAIMMLILSATLYWRYTGNFYAQALRAQDHVRVVTVLTAAKFVVATVVFGIAIEAFGVWGAVIGLALISVLWAWLYERADRRIRERFWATALRRESCPELP